ncbi:sensor histidine kinase [Paenibacillus sp. JNUCC31]|uniref:sensor histidine kinase n=1 Tax=Paenibacillus sp. JNUCC-31 TaxID=2777983 RepID=UPI0017833FCB|nr:sensor histidine kinase [Paenibacillus sp. JNUCC-31]QOS77064.1 sensor histidine kinase [Paenibacillus sp. JNUCC-31]
MPQIPFKVSARAARLIGRENVSNADGALIELIKNSYDAGASICVVYFDCTNQDDNSIYIIDNGHGMNAQVIEDNWMTIGTDNKEHDYLGEDGRVKAGAKGIGRFALDRLGGKAEMITHPKSGKETYFWNVNWEDFEETGTTIENVYANIEINQGFDFQNSVKNLLDLFEQRIDFKRHKFNNGTILKIKELRDDWSDYYIDKINTNLEFLVPAKEQTIFELYVFNKEFPKKYGQISSLAEYDFDYKLRAIVLPNKNIEIEIHRNELDLKLVDMDLFELEEMKAAPYDIDTFKRGFFQKSTTLNYLLPNFEKEFNKNVLDNLGGFEFTMYFIKRSFSNNDRKKFFYRNFDSGKRDSWMNTFSGIKVYRDYFRVRPYGEMEGSSFDWLMLGERAAKSPAAPSHKTGSWRVRPNQISGSISISRLNNLNFEDKSSREGFQENKEFQALKEIIKKIVHEFEYDRQYVMRALDKLYSKKNFDEQDRKQADKIAKNILNKMVDNEHEDIGTLTEKNIKSLNAHNVNILAKSYLAQQRSFKDLITENQLLRALASTGLTLTSFAHDLSNLSSNILHRNNNVKKMMSRLIDDHQLLELKEYQNPFVLIDDMAKEDERLKNWLEFSLNTIKVDKRKRNKVDLYKYFEVFERSWNPVLTFQKVNIVVPSSMDNERFYFRIFEIDFDSIFNNLISNSLSAFRREDASEKREIRIELYEINDELVINYSDSGPGLSQDINEPFKIFDPLFTTKRDKAGKEVGTGLGMWIVRSTVDYYNGLIKITNIRPGFSLQLVFPKRKDEGVLN